VLFPFVLGWAGGYVTWKVFDPSCSVGRGKALYGLPPSKHARVAREHHAKPGCRMPTGLRPQPGCPCANRRKPKKGGVC
jgi:hypothetical protein